MLAGGGISLGVAMNYRLCTGSYSGVDWASAAIAYYGLGLIGAMSPRRAWILCPLAVAAGTAILILFSRYAPGSGTCGD
jgi:hypothetical protein